MVGDGVLQRFRTYGAGAGTKTRIEDRELRIALPPTRCLAELPWNQLSKGVQLIVNSASADRGRERSRDQIRANELWI